MSYLSFNQLTFSFIKQVILTWLMLWMIGVIEMMATGNQVWEEEVSCRWLKALISTVAP